MKKFKNRKIVPKKGKEIYDPQTGILEVTEPAQMVTVKEAFTEAFAGVGGSKALMSWGRHNPAQFFALCTRLIPQEVTGKDGRPLEIIIKDQDGTGDTASGAPGRVVGTQLPAAPLALVHAKAKSET